jgi:hypothetical protein
VAPPPGDGDFDVRHVDGTVEKGWEELGRQAATNTIAAWHTMRTNPNPAVQTGRHHRLKYKLAEGKYKGKTYPQWQIEVTSGARVWYLYDEDRRTCWVTHAGPGHPRKTD